jgi:hypothetical protein
MPILKRLYFFVPLSTSEREHYINIINKYRISYLQRGIQCFIYDSVPIRIPQTVIYLVGQKHIVAYTHVINDVVIQKLLNINIAVQ